MIVLLFSGESTFNSDLHNAAYKNNDPAANRKLHNPCKHFRPPGELRAAVNATGFEEAFSPAGVGWPGKGGGEELVMEEIEQAIGGVVEKFVREVSACMRLLGAHMTDRACAN